MARELPQRGFGGIAKGLPVVGSALGGIAELLDERGVMVAAGDPQALADAIRTLWDDPGACRQLGAAGRDLVERECAPSKFIATFEKLLEEVAI